MNLNDYLHMLLKGVIEDPKNLKQYIIRNQKISERDNFILVEEFYSKINIVLSDLKAKYETRYYNRKKELYLILELKKAKKEAIEEIEKEIEFIEPSKFPLNLRQLTNDAFSGFLNYSDIEFIESVVAEILLENLLKKISKTEESRQKAAYKLEEIKIKLTKNKYTKIFINDLGFNLFEKMFELYEDDDKINANFSFLFYAMDEEFLVCSQKEFIDFVGNEEYKINISKIDSRQSGSNKKSKLYNSIKKSLLIKAQ